MSATPIVAWVNGRWVRAGEAAAPPQALGLLAGLGVFETIGAVAGEMPRWDAHLRRLTASARVLGLDPTPPAKLREAARALLAHRAHENDVLRLTLVAGAECDRSGALWCLTTRSRGSGGPVRLAVVRAAWPADPTAAHKTTSRARYLWALAQAQAAGADDALLVDERDRVLETTTANLWVGGDRVILTPRLCGGVLPGIARAELLAKLRAFHAADLEVREADVTLTDLSDATGLAVSNAVHGPRAAALGNATALGIQRLVELWRAPAPPP
ncbi:MAG: aminotransferase class IV [Planctomycetota bacterium]